MYGNLPSCSIKSSGSTIMKTGDAAFIVKHLDAQRQVGSSGCGLMVIHRGLKKHIYCLKGIQGHVEPVLLSSQDPHKIHLRVLLNIVA